MHANIQHKDARIYTVLTMKLSNSSNEENMRNKKCINSFDPRNEPILNHFSDSKIKEITF